MCVSPVANQSGNLRSCYYSSGSPRVKFSCLQTALTSQRSKGWQGGTSEGSFFSPAVFLAHTSPLQRARICLRKRGTAGVRENIVNLLFGLCLQGCKTRRRERVTASAFYLRRGQQRSVQELNFRSISKRSRRFWTNTDRNGRHEITSCDRSRQEVCAVRVGDRNVWVWAGKKKNKKTQKSPR